MNEQEVDGSFDDIAYFEGLIARTRAHKSTPEGEPNPESLRFIQKRLDMIREAQEAYQKARAGR